MSEEESYMPDFSEDEQKKPTSFDERPMLPAALSEGNSRRREKISVQDTTPDPIKTATLDLSAIFKTAEATHKASSSLFAVPQQGNILDIFSLDEEVIN